MSPISQRFAIPQDDDDFELMCRDLLRLLWVRPGLEIFGKRGERQWGIDILDLSGETPLYAAQCKLKEEHKFLPPAEIQDEVAKAKTFAEPLGKYAILTTARVSTQSQIKVREINLVHRAAGLFEVELLAWDQLCALLNKYPEVQTQFYSDVPVRAAQEIQRGLLAISQGLVTLTTKSDGDEIDSDINDARDQITKHDYQLAILMLKRIQRIKGDKFTPRQKFRLLSNLGAATLGTADPETAARYFREALIEQPSDEKARTNEVLAYLLVGDTAICHEKATALRREYPTSGRLASLWVSSAPNVSTLTDIESQLDSILLTDPEVCVALAHKSLMDLQLSKAFEYASIAAKAAPKWSQPRLIMGQARLGKALHVQLGFDEKSRFQEQTLSDALEEFSIALDLAREEKDHQTEKLALVQRTDVKLILGRTDDAASDALEAERLAANDPHVMLAAAQVRLAAGRLDEGIDVLRKAFALRPDTDIAFIYGRALCNRGRDADIDQALHVLRAVSLKDLRSELRSTFVTQVFQCFAKKRDWLGANEYLTDTANLLESVVLDTIQGYLFHYQEKPKEAEEYALKAKSLISLDARPETKQYLAGLLMLIGRPADALPIWQNLFDSKAHAFDPGNLLNCAARLHRDDIVMQTCEELHARGVNDWGLLEFEVSYLEKYKIETAIGRLKQFIVQQPDHKLARLRLSLIGLGINRSEIVQNAVEDVPTVTELPVNYIVPAVQVLKYGGNSEVAVDYAYRFLRQNFGHIEAHQALMISMMPGDSAPDIPAELQTVVPGAAVCYQELPSGVERWAVLENTTEPVPEFEEIELTSPLSRELLGKKVGETVTIAQGHLQDRTARVLRILPKYVRRYQDSAGEMQIRFGTASFVESIHVDTSIQDPRISLKVLLDSVERRAKAVAEAREIYRTTPASLHLYGSRFGKNAFTAVVDLARDDDGIVKCCQGTQEERATSFQALLTAKALVVDLTALSTLRLLDIERRVFSTTKFKFVISERTWIVVNEMLLNERIFSGQSGTLAFESGKHVMYEHSAEERERRNLEFQEFLDFLKKTIEIKPAPGLAAIEPQRRDTLNQLFGPYGAESIVLASEPGYVLWTDDLIESQVAAQEFGASKTWTQLVLGALADEGLLRLDEYHDATARLVGMNFVVTQFDSESLLSSIRLAKWDPKTPPASQMLKIFAEPNTDLQALLRIFVQFTIKLYAESITPETKRSIAVAFLDLFAQRVNAITLLQEFRKMSPRLFGMNEIGRIQFEACFDRWYRQTATDVIVLP